MTLGALVKGIIVALVDAHKNVLPGTVQSLQSERDEYLDGDTDKAMLLLCSMLRTTRPSAF